MKSSAELTLNQLGQLVGAWTTEATHPTMPGVVVHGTAMVEWLEGEKFLIHRARSDHPDFPDSISILGFLDNDRVDEATGNIPANDTNSQLRMHYFDSRGVFRIYESSIDDSSWRLWRNAPEFSQRFTGRLTSGNNTITGLWQMSRDNVNWDDDLQITYRRKR